MPSKKLLILLICLLALPSESDAQYRNSLQDYYYKKVIGSKRFIRRFSIGGGKHFVSGNANFDYSGWDTLSKTTLEKNVEQSISAKQNWVAYIGGFFPIVPVSDNSMLVFNADIMASIASLTYDSLRFQGKRGYSNPKDAFKVGALLSLDYKVGGEISLNKSEAGMFTLGFGFNPSIVNSDDYNKIPPVKFIPFVKAEVGFFAGIAIKIRGIYYFGNSVYADEETSGISDTGVGDNLKTYMTGTNGFDLAIILIPFSVNWN